jgi:hypothetical protein
MIKSRIIKAKMKGFFRGELKERKRGLMKRAQDRNKFGAC